jgi:hypothetical protein
MTEAPHGHPENTPPTGTPAGVLRRRVLLAVLAVAGLAAILALSSWLAWTALNRPLPVTSDRSELVALDERLQAIESTIQPIATAFTSEPATGLINVGSYRSRIASVRRYVDDTNGLSVTASETIEIRDLIITGGSEVLDGMDAALDALQSDDASATTPALTQVEDGMTTLQDARDKLDALLGKKSST